MDEFMSSPSSNSAAEYNRASYGRSAGTSRLVPNWVMLLTRSLSTVVILASMVQLLVAGRFSPVYLTNWSFLLLLFSFASLTVYSLLTQMGWPRFAENRAKSGDSSHFVASTMALYVMPVYYAFLGKPPFTYGNLVVHGLQLIPIALDLLLGARYDYRFVHILYSVGYLTFYVAAMWIRYAIWRKRPDFTWPYEFLDFRKQTAGVTVGFYVGFFVWVIVASLIVLGVSRGYDFLLDRSARSKSPNAVQDPVKDAEGDDVANV